MKTAKLGDYLLWNGKLAKVVATSDSPMVCIQNIGDKKCPHCEQFIDMDQTWIIVSSPMFQEGAEPIQTISD